MAACAPRWDLSQPFWLVVDSPELPAANAQNYFVSAISQLGGRVATGARQSVHLRMDYDCSCRSCTSYTAAHTDQTSQDTIQMCPWYMRQPDDGLEDNIRHELGHVLGYWGHLPCESGAIMAPLYNCRTDHSKYTKADIEAICHSGGVLGGVCNNKSTR
jgi:hypothetical protein